MHQISDELAFIGALMSDDDLVSSVLNGLGVEYNPFVIAVTTASRHFPLTFADVHGLLLSHESLLQGQSAPSSLPSLESPAAFATRSYFNESAPRGHYHPPTNCYPPRPQYQNQHRPNFSGPPQHGPGAYKPSYSGGVTASYRPSSSSGPGPSNPDKPQCQICFKFVHTAKICYHRFSEDRDLSSGSAQPSTFHAYLTQPTEIEPYDENAEWILDSGATNHITSDVTNLSSFYGYKGTDNL